MFRIGTLLIAVAGITVAAGASAQHKPVKPTLSAEQLACSFQENCAPPPPTASYKVEHTANFLVGDLSKTAGPKTDPVHVNKPNALRPVRAQGPVGRAPKPMHRVLSSPDLQITFLVGTSDMTPLGQANANVLASVMALPKMDGKRWRIEGHTDAQGAHDMNMALSQNRAEAILEFLVAHGIARDRLEAQGFGYDKPLPGIPGTSPANRRAVAVVID